MSDVAWFSKGSASRKVLIVLVVIWIITYVIPAILITVLIASVPAETAPTVVVVPAPSASAAVGAAVVEGYRGFSAAMLPKRMADPRPQSYLKQKGLL